MSKINAIVWSLLSLFLVFGGQIASADEPPLYLFEAVENDKALKRSFNKIMAPVSKRSTWVKNYGTASPAKTEIIDNTEYQIFQGCKPHNCTSESYAVLYNPKTKKVEAGAFVRNRFKGTNLKKGVIIWLGKTDWDQARVISKYLY